MINVTVLLLACASMATEMWDRTHTHTRLRLDHFWPIHGILYHTCILVSEEDQLLLETKETDECLLAF